MEEKELSRNERLRQKMQSMLGGKKAEQALAWLSFAESSFVPIVIDPILVSIILAKRSSWHRYVFIASASSIAGGLAAYLFGLFFFDAVGNWFLSLYGLHDEFASVQKYLDKGAFLFTFIGAFTPVPYKITSLIGGVFQINFFAFMMASIIGRYVRFLIVGYATQKFGKHMRSVFALVTWRVAIVSATIAAIASWMYFF